MLHCALPHLVLSAVLGNVVLIYPCLANGETEAQKFFRNVEKLVLLCVMDLGTGPTAVRFQGYLGTWCLCYVVAVGLLFV